MGIINEKNCVADLRNFLVVNRLVFMSLVSISSTGFSFELKKHNQHEMDRESAQRNIGYIDHLFKEKYATTTKVAHFLNPKYKAGTYHVIIPHSFDPTILEAEIKQAFESIMKTADADLE